MNEPSSLDERFRRAVAAIDAGHATELDGLLAEHPTLACERLEFPGAWLRDTIGAAADGFFAKPYLLWFVAEDPVRNGSRGRRAPRRAGYGVRRDAARLGRVCWGGDPHARIAAYLRARKSPQ